MPPLLICLRTVYSLLEDRTSCQDLASRLSSLGTSFLVDRTVFRKSYNVSEVGLVSRESEQKDTGSLH